jgi:hypothetical protein
VGGRERRGHIARRERRGGANPALAPGAPSPEEEFARRDRLWRTGLLGGRELIEHVEEKRRRGEYVNGLQRGFSTIHVWRESL